MIENTTNESKRLVQRLRNAYIKNSEEGIKEAWRKLGKRFGSNAVVTQVHLEKLKTFPKIGNRENKRLQEFGDLLLELQCAKSDGALKGLKIVDEPAYLRPAVVPAENLNSDEPCWYLRHFGIYHPKNPDKIWVAFDPAAECNGTSLNKLLLPGPDLTVSLECSYVAPGPRRNSS